MIFIVIPIYNEESSVGTIVGQIRERMKEDYRIIAMNDGSTDGSQAVLDSLAGPDLLVEQTLINMNVGAVFSAGLYKATSLSRHEDDLIVIMEGDQTSSIDILFELVRTIRDRGDDVVVASRYCRGGGFRRFPLVRRIYSAGANVLMRRFFSNTSGITDYSIFFRVYRADLIRRAMRYYGASGLIQSHGFTANAELLVKLSFVSKRVSEIPFHYDYGQKHGRSKIRVISTISEYFLVLSYLKTISGKIAALERRLGELS